MHSLKHLFMKLELNIEYEELWEEIQVYFDYTTAEEMNSEDKLSFLEEILENLTYQNNSNQKLRLSLL